MIRSYLKLLWSFRGMQPMKKRSSDHDEATGYRMRWLTCYTEKIVQSQPANGKTAKARRPSMKPLPSQP